MELPVSLQGRQFLWAVLLGVVLGLLYDILRGLRRATGGFTVLSDILFVLFFLTGNCALLLYAGRGSYRLFFPVATALGASLWFFTLSKLCAAFFTHFWYLFLYPFRQIYRLLKKIIKKTGIFLKKGFSSEKKSVKIKRKEISNGGNLP